MDRKHTKRGGGHGRGVGVGPVNSSEGAQGDGDGKGGPVTGTSSVSIDFLVGLVEGEDDFGKLPRGNVILSLGLGNGPDVQGFLGLFST